MTDIPSQLAAALAHQQAGRLAEAEALFREVAVAAPDHALAQFGLGSVLNIKGQLDEAIVCYERAVALKPDFVQALHNLGIAHDMAGRSAAAAPWFRKALALDPSQENANIGMVKILEAEGRIAEADEFRARIRRPMALAVDAAPAPRLTVLTPVILGPGNIPIHTLMPARLYTCIRWYADYATDAQEEALPPADLVFNLIGNADLAEPSAERLTRRHARRPMLNPPAAVLRTRRDRLPDTLAGIPDVVIPPVLRLAREALAAPDLPERLARHGLTGKLVMRPIGTHGGAGMVLIDSAAQLAALPPPVSDAVYLTAYHDYRSADGFYRKYRTIFVDRVPYPYHLAISDKWLVHYITADMLSAPAKRVEEQKFLIDPAAAVGAKAATALTEIARRLDLDFGGIDYSVLPDGRVLVFEANANMSVYLPANPEDYPYKITYVRAILRAFEAMLAKHEVPR